MHRTDCHERVDLANARACGGVAGKLRQQRSLHLHTRRDSRPPTTVRCYSTAKPYYSAMTRSGMQWPQTTVPWKPHDCHERVEAVKKRERKPKLQWQWHQLPTPPGKPAGTSAPGQCCCGPMISRYRPMAAYRKPTVTQRSPPTRTSGMREPLRAASTSATYPEPRSLAVFHTA
jgi:hypothetical protein